MKKRDYNDAGYVFPSAAAFSDKSLGFIDRFDFNRMNSSNTDIVTAVLLDRRDGRWVRNELATLFSLTSKFKNDVAKLIAPRCSRGLLPLKPLSLKQFADDFGSFGSFLFTDAEPFEHFNVNVKMSDKTTFQRFLARMYEIVKNMRAAVGSVQRSLSRFQASATSALALKRKRAVKAVGSTSRMVDCVRR